MSAAGDIGAAAAGVAARIIGDLIQSGMVAQAERARAEAVALAALLARPDPKLLGPAYEAAKSARRKRAPRQ